MKTFRFIYLLLFFSVLEGIEFLSAQSDASVHRYLALRESSKHTMDNSGHWSVSLSAGGTAYFGEMDMSFSKSGDWVCPFGKVTVTRWFSSVWGLRFQVDGGQFKNYAVKEEDPSKKGLFNYVDGYLEVVTNVMNWGHDKRIQRPISIFLLGGVGMVWTPARTSVPMRISPSVILGGQLNIRMTDYWSLALEIDGTIVKDDFNSRIGERLYEGYATVSMGLVYRFL